MDELLKYFKTASLPTEPISINGFIKVTDGPAFVESCRIRHEKGDQQGSVLLNEYKTAIDEHQRVVDANNS